MKSSWWMMQEDSCTGTVNMGMHLHYQIIFWKNLMKVFLLWFWITNHETITLSELCYMFPLSTDLCGKSISDSVHTNSRTKMETKTWECKSTHQAHSCSWEWGKVPKHTALQTVLPNMFQILISYFWLRYRGTYIRCVALSLSPRWNEMLLLSLFL